MIVAARAADRVLAFAEQLGSASGSALVAEAAARRVLDMPQWQLRGHLCALLSQVDAREVEGLLYRLGVDDMVQVQQWYMAGDVQQSRQRISDLAFSLTMRRSQDGADTSAYLPVCLQGLSPFGLASMRGLAERLYVESFVSPH